MLSAESPIVITLIAIHWPFEPSWLSLSLRRFSLLSKAMTGVSVLQATIQDRRLKSKLALDFNPSQSTSLLRLACGTGAGNWRTQTASVWATDARW